MCGLILVIKAENRQIDMGMESCKACNWKLKMSLQNDQSNHSAEWNRWGWESARKPLPNLEGLLRSLDDGDRGSEGTGVASPSNRWGMWRGKRSGQGSQERASKPESWRKWILQKAENQEGVDFCPSLKKIKIIKIVEGMMVQLYNQVRHTQPPPPLSRDCTLWLPVPLILSYSLLPIPCNHKWCKTCSSTQAALLGKAKVPLHLL